MRKDDYITQLYQQTLKDYSAEAPKDMFSKVSKDIGRKSLLTIDPSRLNIFYLALLSGVAALMVYDYVPEETTSNKGLEQKENVALEAEKDIDDDLAYETQVNDLEDEIINARGASEQVNTPDEVGVLAKPAAPLRSFEKSNKEEVLNSASTSKVSDSKSGNLDNLTVINEDEAELPTTVQKDAASKPSETMDEQLITSPKEAIEQKLPQSTTGLELESAGKFLKELNFDKDKKAQIEASSKK